MSENRQHTEEFYEVAQRMPGKYTTFISWGVCIFVVLIFVIGFIAEVPECVYAEVKVISTNPPITLNALSSGKIHILDNRSSIKCKRGQYLAIIENSANYKDIITLKTWLLDNKAFEENNIETVESEITMIPDTTVKVEGKDAEKMQTLIDMLEEHDDVQNVYSNYEMDEE